MIKESIDDKRIATYLHWQYTSYGVRLRDSFICGKWPTSNVNDIGCQTSRAGPGPGQASRQGFGVSNFCSLKELACSECSEVISRKDLSIIRIVFFEGALYVCMYMYISILELADALRPWGFMGTKLPY